MVRGLTHHRRKLINRSHASHMLGYHMNDAEVIIISSKYVFCPLINALDTMVLLSPGPDTGRLVMLTLVTQPTN